jgi:hypothetical protein
MTTEKSFARMVGLVFAVGLTIGVAQIQSQLLTGTPAESPAPTKHRAQKTTETTSPVESSASPLAVQSPTAAASTAPRRIRRKTMAEVSPSPTPTPVASPTPRRFKLRFPRLFKPKSSPSANPSTG